MNRVAHLTAATLLVAVTSVTDAQTSDKPATNPRVIWRHAGGSFQVTKLGEWAEQTAGGDSRFYTQVRSTDDHVELRDIKSGATVRLTRTQCLIKTRNATSFRLVYEGGWEKPAAPPSDG